MAAFAAKQKNASPPANRHFYINLTGSGTDIRTIMTMRTRDVVIVSNTLMGEKALVQSPFHLLVRTSGSMTREMLAAQLGCAMKHIEEVVDG